MEKEKVAISSVDMRIAVAVLVCMLTSTILNSLGMKFTYGEMKLEIIQKMTAAIACILCCQDNLIVSKKSGISRLIITVIGGLVAIAAVVLDNLLQNQWLMVGLVSCGVLLTLLFCKCAGVPYITARIGAVTFILVSCTLAGPARIWYAVFRFVSTLYGVFIVLIVTWCFEKLSVIRGKKNEV